MAAALLAAGAVDRIILSRPAVEAGERLGYLPGDLRDKVDPYLRPLYDALYDMMPGDKVCRRLENGDIEVAPLAFMRGRTLSNAFVILDEAQNTTAVQMKMFLTRLGEKFTHGGDWRSFSSGFAPRHEIRVARCDQHLKWRPWNRTDCFWRRRCGPPRISDANSARLRFKLLRS